MLPGMPSLRTLAGLTLAGGLWVSLVVGASAQTPVSLELVLAVDASSSVNVAEHRLQMQGIGQAFRSPEVVQLIESSNGVAVILFQWASRANTEQSTGWHILKTKESILRFARMVERTRRVSVGSLTAIGSAIEAGLALLDTNGIEGKRRKIDVSGDGRNNSGEPLADMRALATSRAVTINGLAIQTDVPDLARYYREEVTVGPDAFVIAARDYQDFARAMEAKLLRELSPVVSEHAIAPAGMAQMAQ